MRMTLIILSFFLLVDAKASGDKVVEGAFHVISYILKEAPPSAIDSPATPSDMIGGQCTFNGNSCNGAKVILYNSEGKQINESTLVSQSFFQFPKVQKNQNYTLELSWHNKVLDKRTIKSGQFVEIKLSKN